MDLINDVTAMAVNDLIENAIKQIDFDSIENIDDHKKKVLGWIAKIPNNEALIVAKFEGKIKLLIVSKTDLEFKKKPAIIDIQSIVEAKFDSLK